MHEPTAQIKARHELQGADPGQTETCSPVGLERAGRAAENKDGLALAGARPERLICLESCDNVDQDQGRPPAYRGTASVAAAPTEEARLAVHRAASYQGVAA
jgi:hypothetical protein